MTIDKQVARDLLPFVNSEFYEDFEKYISYRITQLHLELEHATDILPIQGAIRELRKLKGLKDQVKVDNK